MSIPPPIRLSCGCTAVWNNTQEQYNAQHTCPEEARRAERLQAMQRSAEESYLRNTAPYHNSLGFKLLK